MFITQNKNIWVALVLHTIKFDNYFIYLFFAGS